MIGTPRPLPGDLGTSLLPTASCSESSNAQAHLSLQHVETKTIILSRRHALWDYSKAEALINQSKRSSLWPLVDIWEPFPIQGRSLTGIGVSLPLVCLLLLGTLP